MIILDHIRHYGEEMIGGINFVGGVSKLGNEEALAVLTPEFLELVPGFFSTDAEESVNSLASLLNLCFTQPLSDDERYLMLGCSVSVPPFVRQGMFSRSIDNDDLLSNINKPVLLTHSTDDLVVKPLAAEQHAAKLKNAKLDIVSDAGHAVFWDNATAFNDSLAAFCHEL